MTRLDEPAAADEAAARPLRRDAARNREALIAAGRHLFAEHGFDTSLDDIAHSAGVGVGTAYRHFANKHDLARAIFTEAIDQVVQIAEQSARHEDAWTGIVGFVDAVTARQVADRGLREVMMGIHQDDAEADEIHRRIAAPLLSTIRRAKAQGQLREDAEASDIGMILTMLCEVADLSAEVSPQLWQRYRTILLDGLRPGSVALPVAALDDDQLHSAMRSKHRATTVQNAR